MKKGLVSQETDQSFSITGRNPHEEPSNQPLTTNPQVCPSRRETLNKFDYPKYRPGLQDGIFCYKKNFSLISSTGISFPVQILKASAP